MHKALLLVTLATASAPVFAHDPAPTAGDRPDVGVLHFAIVDEEGRRIPGRLTFTTAAEVTPDLFPNAAADPDHLAVRRNVVYTIEGEGAITVPPGVYTVYASRGLEWSIASAPVTIRAGAESSWTARLTHEVDTRGWVSGDFHLHTLTYSGHGDSNLNERIISLVGEGVEFAVATDHNHNTDYGPTIEHLHAHEQLSSVVGNEISTPVGHFNAFPLDAGRPVVPARIDNANVLFEIIRQEPNEFGVTPIIQLNHPRWGDIDYFGRSGLDPVTGRPTTERYSGDFDSLEIFNENEGWGYYQVGVDDVPTGQGAHSVLQDWFNLLNLGHRYAAVGNSDSHTVHYDFAGYPRNFVRSATDSPDSVDVPAIVGAVRDNAVFTTVGPFVEFSAGGVAMGGETAASRGEVELAIRVQAASWIDVDRVKIVRNGDVIEIIDIPPTGGIERLNVRRRVPFPRDGWVSLLVEGDDSLSPIVCDQGRPILPLAVTNPVWVDADGNGSVTSPADWAAGAVARARSLHDLEVAWSGASPAERALLVLAGADGMVEKSDDLVSRGLRDPARQVRLAAARAAEHMEDRSMLSELERLWLRDDLDAYLRLAVLRALAASGDPDVGKRVLELVDRVDPDDLAAAGEELNALLPGDLIREWSVVGYFPCEGPEELEAVEFGPEREAGGEFAVVPGGRAAWTMQRTRANGYLDLQSIDPAPGRFENVVAYAQAWILSDTEREVPFAMGSDDGCVVYVNGERVLTDLRDHSALPMQNVGRMRLEAGWNRVLVKVANYAGGFGLYFRPIADGLEVSALPRP